MVVRDSWDTEEKGECKYLVFFKSQLSICESFELKISTLPVVSCTVMYINIKCSIIYRLLNRFFLLFYFFYFWHNYNIK